MRGPGRPKNLKVKRGKGYSFVIELAEKYGINYSTLWYRLFRLYWPISKACKPVVQREVPDE